jgi:GT2 family glycosyltransferase
MIPVLGIPVLNRPDLLAACVASIDADVGRLVIIDNSDERTMGAVARAALPPNVAELRVVEPPSNLGFPASVNLVIRTAPAEPWWCIANADTEFGQGDLGRLAAAMADPAPRWAGIVDWRVFGLNAAAVDAAGFWDENFHPAYCEDADYEWRCSLAGVEMVRLMGATKHIGSVGYLSDPRKAAGNARSYPSNLAYYSRKWGGPLRGGERFTTPFDAGGHVGDWRLERARLAANAW